MDCFPMLFSPDLLGDFSLLRVCVFVFVFVFVCVCVCACVHVCVFVCVVFACVGVA